MQSARYRLGARWYEELSFERLLYRHGRLLALRLLGLRPGDRVLDVGCGTGLDFAAATAAVGPTGQIVGLDASAAMLREARRRVDTNGWEQVHLVLADAANLSAVCDSVFDAIVFCYSLSIVPRWQDVWRQGLSVLAAGGRVAVVDTAYLSGPRRVLNPLVGVQLHAGGVHPERRVWEAVQQDTVDVRTATLRAGHVRVAVGTKRP